MKIRILITGGSGFVGKNLINSLFENNNNNIEIYNLSPTSIDKTIHIKINRNELFDFSTLNIEFDYIIHTLALSSDKYCKNFDLAEKINIIFTRKILEYASMQRKIKKFLYFSSITLYDNENISPVKETDKLNPFYGNYSFTKGVAEEYVKYFGKKQKLPFIILRISNLYGPGQKYINSHFLIPEKIYEAIKTGVINLQNPTPIRDFLYISDAVEAIKKILFTDSQGIYNLGSGIGISIGDLIGEIAKELNVKIIHNNLTSRGPTKFYSDISKIQNTIDWKPSNKINDGINKTIKYIKNNLNINK